MKSLRLIIGMLAFCVSPFVAFSQIPVYYGEPGVIYTTGSVNVINDDATGYTPGLVPQTQGLGRSIAVDNSLGLVFFTSWAIFDPSSAGAAGGIHVLDLNTGISSQVLVDLSTGIPDIEVDPFTMTVYWTDFTRGEIRSASYDAAGVLGPITTEISGRTNPFGLALEGLGGPITFYWSETTSWNAPGSGGSVYTATSGGGSLATLTSGFNRIDDVELDPLAGTLYFSNWASGSFSTASEGIHRMNIDGTGLIQIVGAGQTNSSTSNASGMHSIALDPNNGVIYFTRGVSYANGNGGGEMSRINYDGTGYVMLNPASTLHFPGGVALGIDPPVLIPTMSQWGLFILGLFLTSMAVVTIRKRILAAV